MREGIEVNRDTKASVLLEKTHWLGNVKSIYPEHEAIFYPAADAEVVHIVVDGKDISFASAKGSSFTANMAERLRITGARAISRIGTCGALQPSMPLWSPIVTTAAYKDEGTSRHYLDNRFPSVADFDLSQTMINALRSHGFPAPHGITVTTDGRWREDMNMMAELAKAGVLSIEMETGALFTVCQFRGLLAAAINIPTDYPLQHGDGDFKGVKSAVDFRTKLDEILRGIIPVTAQVLANSV